MYVKFTKDSVDLQKTKEDQRENLNLGLSFNKDEVRYETRGAKLVENGVAEEVDYEDYLAKEKANQKPSKKITVTEAKKATPAADVKAATTETPKADK